MSDIKCVNIKFKPTGNVFNIPEDEAKQILADDRGNFEYEVLDEDFVYPAGNDVLETTTFEQVVEDDKQEQAPTYKEILEKKKVKELINYCDENNIEYAKNDKKSDLINKILANPEPVVAAETEE